MPFLPLCSPLMLNPFISYESCSRTAVSWAPQIGVLWFLFISGQIFTPHPILLFIFSISAPLSTPGQAQSVCQRDPNPLSASLPGSQHIWSTYSLPSKLGFLRQRLRCCSMISPLVPLHSHLLGRGAVSVGWWLTVHYVHHYGFIMKILTY